MKEEREPTLVLNSRQIDHRIARIAYQIYEDNFVQAELLIVGIANSGYVFAQLLQTAIEKICPIPTRLIEIRLDKDQPTDYTMTPSLSKEELKDKVVIVVDDVLNSGKTLIYSLRPFLEADMRKIRTVLLVDRDHKRYPVEADFVGVTLSTTLQEHVKVDLEKGKEAVYLV
jgi:pyrimidine operon attenuation protein/uracil phosphoribosyltransferase